MKMVIQRVSRAEVRVGERVVSRIGIGLMVLVAIERGDDDAQLEKAAKRLATLRIFEDDNDKMNLGLEMVGGAVLAVSQFTLAGSIRKGRRPSFDHAMPFQDACVLFDRFVEKLRKMGVEVQTGEFGAMMDVDLVNSGPVTLIWDSDETRV